MILQDGAAGFARNPRACQGPQFGIDELNQLVGGPTLGANPRKHLGDTMRLNA